MGTRSSLGAGWGGGTRRVKCRISTWPSLFGARDGAPSCARLVSTGRNHGVLSAFGLSRSGVSLGWLKRAMQYAFTQTDREVLLAGINDGTTGVCLAVSSTHLLVSNCGDSRAVLWDSSDGGVNVSLSSDHKPSRKGEAARIEALGGHITNFGVPRVNGVLAVSRAIGDAGYKRFLISDPEQRSVRRRPGQVGACGVVRGCKVLPCELWPLKKPQFLTRVLASCGWVFDVVGCMLGACWMPVGCMCMSIHVCFRPR